MKDERICASLQPHATSLAHRPRGYIDDGLRSLLARIPSTGLPGMELQVLSLQDNSLVCDELLIADSTLHAPLSVAFPLLVGENSKEVYFVRLTAPSQPVVHIVFQSGSYFIGSLAMYAGRAAGSVCFDGCRVVPILDSLNPSSQKHYDGLSEHQQRFLGYWGMGKI